VAWFIVTPSWNMWVAMISMMTLGMILGLVLFFPLSIKLGAHETMIPAMYTGMWAGMFVGMIAAMMPLTMRHAGELGTMVGAAEIVFIWIVNTLLRGVTREASGA
ncbi:hypothetical protein ACNJUL_21015, partial [Mycobacterium tuberculosis]